MTARRLMRAPRPKIATAYSPVPGVPARDLPATEIPPAGCGHEISRLAVQRSPARMTVSRAGDPQEQEAEQVAGRVMRMGTPAAPATATPEDEDPEKSAQAAPGAEAARQVMRRVGGDAEGLGDVSPAVSRGVTGGGQPLNQGARSFLEPRFGHDFSRVRVHTDARAAQSADALAARAYTVGSDVVFGEGQYAPGTADGRHLLAHELTHTIQQGAVPATGDTLQRSAVAPPVGISETAAPVVQRDTPPFNSGATLNSPSYVNAPSPPGAALGGPTASAGNSPFVTGGVGDAPKEPGTFEWGGLLVNAAKLKSAYENFDKTAKMLRDQGAGTGGFFGKSDDKPLLAAAENLLTFAKGLSSLGDALAGACNHPEAKALKTGDTGVGYALNVVKATETLANLADASKALGDMAEKKDLASAEAWARDIGGAFDNLAGAIPDGGLPGFDGAYIKGLLALPKNVINSFISVMEVHYGKIDEEAGIYGDSRQSYSILKDKVTWTGDLCGIYDSAYLQPKSKDGASLMDFMENHRKTEGVDLWKTTVAVGRALLVAAIQRDAPPDVKDAWAAYMAGAG